MEGLLVHANFACEDYGLSFWLRFGKAALDEKKVEALASSFGLHGVWSASGAALDQIFGDFAEARGAVGVGREFGDGFCGEIAGHLVRALETMNGGIRGLLLRSVFSGSFSEGGGRFFDIENVVGDLKKQAEGFAKSTQAGNVFCRGTRAQSAGSYGRAD